MPRARYYLPVLACLLLAGGGPAADTPPALVAAQGVIDKVERDSLTIRPRGETGKFEKGVKLRLTGTSKISVLMTRMQKDKVVLLQKDAAASDLQAKQTVAVIYAESADGPVLLSAVAQPAGEK